MNQEQRTLKDSTVQVYDREFKQYSRSALHSRISELLEDLSKDTQLRCFLEDSGFEIERVAKDASKNKQLILKPLALMIQMFSKMLGRKGQEKYWLQEANSEEILIGGNTLIIISRLRADARPVAA